MPDGGNPISDNKREFSRVDARIRLEVRLVPVEERQDIRSRTEGTGIAVSNLPPDVNDPALAEWLKFLHAKIDAILRLMPMDGKSDEPSPYKMEDISGGGISFTSPENFVCGDILEIKMFPYTLILKSLYLYGEVVSSEKKDGNWLTAVRFILLDDTLRDEIVRFVFEREREILRKKREGG